MVELHVYYADTPLGPWRPHARNPVMVAPDRRGARMGGSFARHHGKLIRFGQDCTVTYGHSVCAGGGGGGGLSGGRTGHSVNGGGRVYALLPSC